MSAFQFLLAVFVLAAFLQCQAVPPDEFFPVGSLGSDQNLDRSFPPLTTSCGTVSQVAVFVTGTANLADGTNPLVTFTPFLVDSNDLENSDDKDSYELMLDSDPESASVSRLQNLYETYYPREGLFTIEQVITVTWTLTTNPSGNAEETNRFQLVIGFNTMNNSIFILYQYEDDMMQWNSENSEVSMDICDIQWQYMPPNSPITLNAAIVTDSNVNLLGRYAFLYRNMMIDPAVICSESCSIDNGFCTVENTCECQAGWKGENCTQAECYESCKVNGGCPNEPYKCECNDGWNGENCTTASCSTECMMNGRCETPYNCTCNEGYEGENCGSLITTPVSTETPTSGSSQSILISTMLTIVFGICTLFLSLG